MHTSGNNINLFYVLGRQCLTNKSSERFHEEQYGYKKVSVKFLLKHSTINLQTLLIDQWRNLKRVAYWIKTQNKQSRLFILNFPDSSSVYFLGSFFWFYRINKPFWIIYKFVLWELNRFAWFKMYTSWLISNVLLRVLSPLLVTVWICIQLYIKSSTSLISVSLLFDSNY